MTLKLYFAPGACSFVPHTLLEVAGEPFEPVLVKLHKQENYSPEYKAINPRSQVPVLVDGGETITQILAIVNYLDARFPQAGFLPHAPLARARVIETLAWMPELHADLKAYNTTLYAGMLDELETLVGRALAQGQAWLGGERFGPLDAYHPAPSRWAGPGPSHRLRCPAPGKTAGRPARARPRARRGQSLPPAASAPGQRCRPARGP
jgi:glutathione S-transferase